MDGAKEIRALALRLRGLAVFRGLLANAVIGAFAALLDAQDAEERARVSAGAAFAAALYGAGGDFGAHLLKCVRESDNAVVRIRAAGQVPPATMMATLRAELALLTELSQPRLHEALWAQNALLPRYDCTPQNLAAACERQLDEAAVRGWGMFAAHHMFAVSQSGALVPVRNPDPQRLCQLEGYERERRQVVLNTRALLGGLAAGNILLYGDAGTGKSSTVKAIANDFCDAGLRLVEVRKHQLYHIPAIMDELAGNPLKFILFIDDLSFPADDGDFMALKAILEGNISVRPRNVVVYATSNRRHMLRQNFAERAGGDVRPNDTLEEQASLSARFGLTVTFLKPDRALYAQIVKKLAAETGLKMDDETLLSRAEAHAIRYGGRSPRTARQFVELAKAEEAL